MKNFNYPSPDDDNIAENPQELPTQGGNAYNPFDLGISKAIEQSRQNFGMTRNQQHGAINNAVLNFGNAIAKEPVVSGFKNNLGVFGRAMNPALQSYNQSEDTAIKENNALANQILQHRRAQEALESAQEEKAWNHKFKERAFNEQQKEAALDRELKEKIFNLKNKKYNSDSELDRIAPMIRTDSAFDKVGLQTKKAADFYEEVTTMDKLYKDLKDTMAKAGIDTSNPFVFKKAIRNASGFLSSFSKDPVQREIATKYADLAATNKRAMQTAEKALKDGALTNFTVKYGDNNNLFPNFNENFDVYEKKLGHMLEDAKNSYESTNLSLQTGRHIDKHNYHLIKQLEDQGRRATGIDNDEIDSIPTLQNYDNTDDFGFEKIEQ
jgi:hypothetical protein